MTFLFPETPKDCISCLTKDNHSYLYVSASSGLVKKTSNNRSVRIFLSHREDIKSHLLIAVSPLQLQTPRIKGGWYSCICWSCYCSLKTVGLLLRAILHQQRMSHILQFSDFCYYTDLTCQGDFDFLLCQNFKNKQCSI